MAVKRRTILKGLGGAALAAPFLSSLHTPAKAAAPTVPKRLVMFYTNNGCIVPKWGPTAPETGALDPATFAGTTLEWVGPLASKLLIPRGLAMFPRGNVAVDGVTYFDPHDQGMGSKLTAGPIDPAAEHYALNRSLDHVAAELVNPGTKTPLVLSVGRSFGSNVKQIVSYSAPKTPYPAESSPKNVYTSLTGLFQTGGMSPADYRVTQGNSIIDLVRGDLDALKRQPMSTADQKRIDDWLTLLRETERPIVSAACNAENATALGITDAAITAATGSGRGGVDTGTAFVQGGDMMIKLIALTMMCDANRVIIMQWPGFVTFNFDGIAHMYDHHGLSHRNGTNAVGGDPIPGVEDMIFEIDRWYGKRYGTLVNLINSITEGEGTTMLDNSAVMWLPELSDGNAHNNDKLPIVIAGSMGGYFKQGQAVKLDMATTGGGRGGGGFGSGGVPLNKLYAMLLNGLGAKDPATSLPFTTFGTTDNNTVGTITNPGEFAELKA
jgi:uncharacterized protein DUF1552